MSRPIDEKIVKMKMDNSDFKAKASATVGIFGKLQSAFGKVTGLNLSRSVADISKINTVAGQTDMSGLVNGVGKVTASFSALSIMAATVLSNITTKALDAGMNMAKQFTLEPIMAGFQEYELKMGSIQTILANTSIHGTTLDQVTASLDELNTYADKTIYNFGDMTKNIGLFTNAGIKVEEATSMIKGFSNEAATSGTTAEGAAGAAYQLSQALSAGTIRLMDWRSLQNVGMGSKKMQTGIIEIADAMGELEKNSTSSTEVQKDFNGSLEKNWLSADVMSNYLKIMAGDMTDAEMAALGLTEAQVTSFKESAKTAEEAATKVRTLSQLLGTATEAIGSGWTETMELLFGDFNEATEMFTQANDAIGALVGGSAKARNDLVKGFVDLGGRAKIIDTISNSFKALMGFLSVARDGFREVFPAVTAEMLMKMVTGLAEFSEKLQMSSETGEKVKTIFTGLFSILSIGWTVAKQLGNAIKALIPAGTGGAILDFLVTIADMIIAFDQSTKGSEKMTSAFKDIGEVVDSIGRGIGKFVGFVSKVVGGSVDAIVVIANALKPVVDFLSDAIGDITSNFSISDIINAGFIGALILGVKKFSGIGDDISGVIGKITDVIGNIGDSIEVFGKLGDALSAMTGNIKADSLLKIALAVGVLAVSLKLIATINGQDLSKSLTAIAITMFMLNTSLGSIAKSGIGIANAIGAAVVLVALAGAVLALSVGLKIIASMDAGELAKGLIGMVVIVTALVIAIKSLSKISGGMGTSAVAMIGLSIAVVILANAVEKLSEIKASSLAKAVGALGIILLELALFLKVVDGAKLSPASAVGIVLIAAAVKIMVSAIEDISKIDSKQLIKGLGVIAVILAEIAIFTKVTSGAKIMGASVGMVLIAAAINMLITPIQEFASMSLEELAKGLGAMAVALGTVVLSMKLAQGGIAGSVGIIAVAVAMNMLVVPLQILGNMSLEQLAKGLGAMAIGLGVVAIAAKLIGITGAVALLAFAAAVGAVGLAALAISVALSAFAAAITIVVAVLTTNIGLILTGLGQLILGLTALIPMGVNLITVFIVSMAVAIATAAPVLANAAGVTILGVLTAMAVYVPQFVEQGLAFLTGVMTAFGEGAGPLIAAGVVLMIQLIDGMATALEDNHVRIVGSVLKMVKAVLLIIVEAMIQLVDVLFGWIPGVSAKTKEMGGAAKDALDAAFDVEDVGTRRSSEFIGGIDSKKGEANSSGKGLGNSAKEGAASTEMGTTGTNKGTEFTTGVGNKSGEARIKGTNLGTNARDGAGSVSLNNTGSVMALGFTDGLGTKTTTAEIKGKSLTDHAKTGAGSVSMYSTGQQSGEGFAQGVESKGTRVSNAANFLGGLAKGALKLAMAVRSPSREMMKIGVFSGEGFAIGMENTGGKVIKSATQMANGALVAVQGYAKMFSDEMLNNMDLSPTITPILDLNNMRKFSLPDSFSVGTNVDTRNINTRGEGSGTNGDTYNIEIHATGDLPDTTIRKMANKFQTEIKNQNDRKKFSRGEAVVF